MIGTCSKCGQGSVYFKRLKPFRGINTEVQCFYSNQDQTSPRYREKTVNYGTRALTDADNE